jgi:protease-4
MFKNNKTQSSEEQLADIAKEFVKQNKSRRRWRIFFFIIFISYAGFMSYISLDESGLIDNSIKKNSPFAAEVLLTGTIQTAGEINSDDALDLLTEAFRDNNSKGVILRLNSPGGSPVQSNQIYNGILRLKGKYNKKLYVVIDDICTSGCYYIAAAADNIYADKSSIIGSIGVLMSGFGLVGAIEKLGIERRLYVSGKNKALMDAFSKENNLAVSHIQKNILDKSHKNFINAVKKTRGDRLSTNEDIFTGLIWLGDDAKKLGLIDDISDASTVASSVIGVDERVIYEKEKSLLEQLTESTAKGVAFILSNQIFSNSVVGNLR